MQKRLYSLSGKTNEMGGFYYVGYNAQAIKREYYKECLGLGAIVDEYIEIRVNWIKDPSHVLDSKINLQELPLRELDPNYFSKALREWEP